MFFKKTNVTSLIAWMVLISGIINILSSIFAFSLDRFKILEIFIPLNISNLSRTLSVVIGICLIYISKSMYERKARAYYLSLIFLLISIGTHLIKGLDIEELIGNLLLFILLIKYRKFYIVKSNKISFIKSLRNIALIISSFLLYLYLGHIALSKHFKGDINISNIAMEYYHLSTGYGKDTLTPINNQSTWFHSSLQIIEILSLLAIISSLLAPFVEKGINEDDFQTVLSLVERLGKNCVSPLAMMPDKQYFLNKDKTAVIAYRISGKYLVVLGDPISYLEETTNILDEFYSYCKLCGLSPIWYNCSSELLDLLSLYKIKNVEIGEEAEISLNNYDLTNPKLKKVRNSVSRIGREQISWQWYKFEDIPWKILHDIDDLHVDWVNSKKMPKMGFSLDYYPFPVQQKGYVLVGYRFNKIVSAMSFFSYSRGSSYVLEMMIRATDAPNGIMQTSLDIAINKLRMLGATTLNLGLAPVPPVNKKLQIFLSSWYKFQPLKEFKSQFNPTWKKKYLAYSGNLEFPRVLLAITQIHLGK